MFAECTIQYDTKKGGHLCFCRKTNSSFPWKQNISGLAEASTDPFEHPSRSTPVLEMFVSAFNFFIPHHTIEAGYYSFTLDVRVSVRLSVVCPSICLSVSRFQMITWVNNGFSSNLVCVLILWKSGLGLLMGKFRQFFTELSAQGMPIFLFPGDNLSKQLWIVTKLGMCIDILQTWFGIANGQIFSNFDVVICPRHAHIFVFGTITWVNVKGF